MAEVNRSSKALHLVADTLTCCNLASGITAILLSEEGPPVRRSALLLFGALCDSVDGTFARRSGNPTVRGATADHFADFISFGIAPAAILAGYGSAREAPLSRIASGLYIAAAAGRKIRYGTGPRTSHVFRGLPDMGAGIIFVVGCQMKLSPRALTYLTLGLGAAMLSSIRVLSGEGFLRRLVRRDLENLSPSVAG
jgi:phosphatidylserine synthase